MARDALQTLGGMVTAGREERPVPLHMCLLRHRLSRLKARGALAASSTSTDRGPAGVANRKTQNRTPNRNDPFDSAAGWRASVAPRHTYKSPASFHSMARIARGPASSTNARIPSVPAAPMAEQMAKRASHGNATANHVTAQASANHANQAVAPRSEGIKSIRLQEVSAQRRAAGIGWDISRQQITRDVRVRQFEKVDEGGAFVTCGLAVAIAQVSHEQEIEFLHAAPALPLKLAELAVHGLRVQSVLALEHHFLDLGDRLCGIEILRACLGAIHDGVATI